MPKALLLASLICLSLGGLRAAETLSFGVASIHPHDPRDSRFHVNMPTHGHFAATGAVAKLILMLAYDVQENQIVGGPNWLDSEKWDIEAKSEDQIHSTEETRAMLRTMLEERFGLRVHRETQSRPAYILAIAKGGPKFKAQPDGRTNYLITGNSITLERGDLAHMAQLLSTALGRPVIDRTGLSGIYDLSLKWDDAPIADGGLLGLDAPAAPENDRGSIFTAIQDQLGLRLESQRAPVDVIVIDQIARPSAN